MKLHYLCRKKCRISSSAPHFNETDVSLTYLSLLSESLILIQLMKKKKKACPKATLKFVPFGEFYVYRKIFLIQFHAFQLS